MHQDVLVAILVEVIATEKALAAAPASISCIAAPSPATLRAIALVSIAPLVPVVVVAPSEISIIVVSVTSLVAMPIGLPLATAF